MRFYDAHNHLQDERFEGRQEALIRECRAVGVVRMVVNGSSEEDWEQVATLARQHPDLILPAFGVHPWYSGEVGPDWQAQLIQWLDELPNAGVGEIGLDRWRRGLDPAKQEAVFRAQWRIAVERNLPVTVHCLRAWTWLLKVLETEPTPSCGWLFHSFGGPAEAIEPFLRRGAYFSLAGYFARPDRQERAKVFQRIPLERILIETDAPDQCLPPERDRYGLVENQTGRRINHPANLPEVYEFAAELLGIEIDKLAEQVEENFHRLFVEKAPA